ncbi:ABC transporter [Antarcticirhabdus aurantiaca]|jgi:hypothetical protein|uniref:ABC transporter n=1 Tax=Antarcticirhabdus aurantiaca TaxID=2606717 RepID=A0ACD4NH86_9HYPH|nr:ABC transporter [Antarcticirhabdus aurantiaca]WAJ26187.1 ABC transporter [Jeongeuplla avenae]
MKNIMVIAAVSFAMATLAGCAGDGIGKGVGKGKGKGPVVVEEPAPVVTQDTYVSKG